MSTLNFDRGLFRLWITLTVLWVPVAIFLYVAGVGWKYKSYHGGGMFILEGKQSAESVQHLPTIDQFQQMADRVDETPPPTWEVAWARLSLGALPALYGREFRGPSCQSIQVRNYANVVASLPTTCVTQWSWMGFVSFLFVPAVVLALVLFAGQWVAKGFVASNNAS